MWNISSQKDLERGRRMGEWGCVWGGAQCPAEHKLLQGDMVELENSALMPEHPGTGG